MLLLKYINLDDGIQILAEFLGSAVLLFLGGLAVPTDESDNHLETSLHFSMFIMVISQCFRIISGANVHPSFTIISWFTGEMSTYMAFFSVIVQIMGALCGYAWALQLLPDGSFIGVRCVPQPSDTISLGEAFVIEFLLITILVFGWCALKNLQWGNELQNYSSSWCIGLIISTCSLAGGQYTGAPMNPLRVIAPSILYGVYDYIWFYMSAHLSATLCVALFWVTLCRGGIKNPKTEKEQYEGRAQLQITPTRTFSPTYI